MAYTENHFSKIIQKSLEKLEKTNFSYPHSARVAEVMEAMSYELEKKGVNVLDFGLFQKKYSKLTPFLKNMTSQLVGSVGFTHDVGKRLISEKHGHELWEKRNLSEKDWSIIKKHPEESALFIKKIPGKFSNLIADLILYHHLNFDGSGYPQKENMKGKNIPLITRMLKVADALDSMIYTRPYRKGMKLKEAVKELERNKGTQFDPMMVDLLKKMIKSKNQMLKTYVK